MDEKKKIEELSEFFYHVDGTTYRGGPIRVVNYDALALALYDAGYRKQREGKWKIKSEIHQMFDDVDEELYVECPFCKRTFWIPYEFEDEKIFEYARDHYPYCNCGASMKGVAK